MQKRNLSLMVRFVLAFRRVRVYSTVTIDRSISSRDMSRYLYSVLRGQALIESHLNLTCAGSPSSQREIIGQKHQ